MTCLSKDNSARSAIKSLLPPSAAEYYLEGHLIFEISQSEISKMRCPSKDNSARSALKSLPAQPQFSKLRD
jgi:hypothetical protein